MIEIKPDIDKINNFLEIDDKVLEIECKKKSIYILHYPRDKRLVSYGLMKDILNGKTISHYCNTEGGSSGSPILLLNSFKVIGVHFGGQKGELNYGTFIKYAINEFNKKYKITNEITIKYKIEKNDKIKIFGEKFVENNKNNYELIINDKKYDELIAFTKIENERGNEILNI